MPVLLLPLSYLLLFLIVRTRHREFRSAAILAACIWGSLLAVITELLSLPHLLTRTGLSIAWSSVCLLEGGWLWRHGGAGERVPLTDPSETAEPIGNSEKLLLGATAVLLALVGLTAIVSPPNSWDAMEYHLPRVAMWISNRSIQFYPTLDYVQLVYAPWAEYAMLHLDLLFGGDRMVNLVQWFSLLGICVTGSLIARELGAKARGQVLTTVACATIPTAILEASGAMNDVVAAFWISACVYLLIVSARDPRRDVLIAAAIAFGLAILTKGSAYSLLPPIGLACWWLAPSAARRRFIARAPLFALVVLVLNLPQWYRNYELTGTPIGTEFAEGGKRFQMRVGRLSIRGAAANVIRSLALHVTVSAAIDDYAGRVASRAVNWISGAADDPDFLWQTAPEGGYTFLTNAPSRDEILVGEPLHLLLIALAVVLVFAARAPLSRAPAKYAIGLIGSFLLFCALLRWQRWGARWQLPLFVLGAPLIGLMIPRYLGQGGILALGALLIVAALPLALSNQLRPLLFAHLAPARLFTRPLDRTIWSMSRTSLYFTEQHEDLEDSYAAAATAVRRSACDRIGIDNSLEHYEYPVLALLNPADGRRRVFFTGVYNRSGRLFSAPASPCAVICFACAHVPEKWREYRPIGGRVSIYGRIAVFSGEGQIPNSEQDSAGAARAADLLAVVADMSQSNARLVDFSRNGEGSRDNSYGRTAGKFPDREALIMQRFHAVERPVWDARRVWESTEPLRRKVLSGDGFQVDPAPLIAADEALRDFADDAPREATEFTAFVDSLVEPHATRANVEHHAE